MCSGFTTYNMGDLPISRESGEGGIGEDSEVTGNMVRHTETHG